MADPSPDHDPDTETGTPLWVKVFGIIFLGVVVLFLFLMFTRGPHRGPGHHISPEGHTQPRSNH